MVPDDGFTRVGTMQVQAIMSPLMLFLVIRKLEKAVAISKPMVW